MIKRIVVAGSRDYENYGEAKTYIEMCIKEIREKYTLIFLSGGCRGADMLGERYTKENGFTIERYPADWQTYGKSAGPKRNLQMAKACDYVMCFCYETHPSNITNISAPVWDTIRLWKSNAAFDDTKRQKEMKYDDEPQQLHQRSRSS